jgi:nitroreductase
MELWDVLKRRKMVRTFEQRPVPREVIDGVVASVVHAPSAGYTQGNEYLVLDDPAAVADFFRITDDAEFPLTEQEKAGLPTVVVLPLANEGSYVARYAEPDKIEYGLDDAARWPVPYWDVDAGMASMLMLLVAIDEGLGAWFSGIFANERAMLDRFGVPEGFRPIGFVGLGYAAATDTSSAPASGRKRRRRPVEELVHRNAW